MISAAPLSAQHTALLMIDLQEEYFIPDGENHLPDGPRALACAADLLDRAREHGLTVIHVRHVSEHPVFPGFRLGTPAVEIRPEVAPLPGERVIDKRTPSAFAGTPLQEALSEAGIVAVIVAGFMTATCCTATSHEAIGRRYRTVLVSDATAAQGYGPQDHVQVHERALDTVRQLGGEILSAESVEGLLGDR